MKCSYLGTFEFFEAFKSCKLALQQACAHQNTSYMLEPPRFHNKSVS